MKILIGYDGSECADRALNDLGRAGLPRDMEAIVLSVAESWLPPPPPSSYEIVEAAFEGRASTAGESPEDRAARAIEDAFSMSHQASKLVESRFPSWKVSADACDGSPAWELIERSEKWKADLIVVGSHGRSALGRLILGSISQRVVTEAPCSVRVARGNPEAKDGPVRLVIGVDGSASADAAVQAVAARSWPEGSQVCLITAVEGFQMYAVEPEDKFARVRLIQAAAEEPLRAAGLEVSSLIEEADPKHLLVKEAEAWKADAIFVGARGLGRIGRLLLGSVSTAVVSRAHCSVEVVRPRLD